MDGYAELCAKSDEPDFDPETGEIIDQEPELILKPIYDVKMDGPDLRVQEGFRRFMEYEGKPKFLPPGAIDATTLEQAAKENVGYAFNEGYLKPLQNPATPASVKKSITDALLERAHGKVGQNVTVEHTGHVGVITISNEDIARLIAAANERATESAKALALPQ